jgi:hypothetical protein
VTVLADLADEGSLAREAYDCVLLVDAWRGVRDIPRAMMNGWTAVAPGGTLLITWPEIARGSLDALEVEETLRCVCQDANTKVMAFEKLLTGHVLKWATS